MPQRSPLIFWLLLAATLCVNAVVFSRTASETFPAPSHLVISFYALTLSQVSVVCIWSALRPAKNVWTRLVPYLTAVIAAVLSVTFIQDPVGFGAKFTLMLAQYGFHTVLLMIALWFLQRTAFWRRRNGTTYKLQFSTAHLLIAMTVVAVLIALMRESPFFGYGAWINLGFAFASVILALASVVIWSLSFHWLLRLAGIIGIVGCLLAVIFLSTALSSTELGNPFSLLLGGYYLIQALVLSIWLGLGPVMPVAGKTVAGET